MRGLPLRAVPFVFAGALMAAGVTITAQPPEQEQEPQPPVFRAEVNLVRVDVSVSDGQGNPIEGLTAEDFDVQEDGVSQTVETVQFVRLDGQRTSQLDESLVIRSPEHAAVEAARDDVRLFAIFLDDYHVDKAPVITLRLRPALVEFVKQFGPNDLVAVMDPLTPLTHLEFTRDQATLIDRMTSFEGRMGEYYPVRSAAEEAQMRLGNPATFRAGVTLSALEALVTHLGGLRETRASILFVSQGPDVNDPNNSNWHRLEDVLRAANRTNVTIHVLDPRPLGGGFMGSLGLLRRLATETGGRAIVNTNDPADRLEEVLVDASAYYLVGYTPTREVMADGEFHRIEVNVRRRGARVLARRGYWAPSEKEMTDAAVVTPEAPERTSALAALLEPATGRPVDVWVGAGPGSGGRTEITLTWESTAPSPANPATTLEVEPIESNDGAALADPVTIAAGADDAATVAAFELEPGTLSLRLTARDADGATIDRWVQPLAVPDLNGVPVVIATPRFLRSRSAFEFRAMRTNPSPTPAASRRFRRTDRVLVDFQVVTPPGVTADVTAELLNADGQVLVPLPVPELDADGTARFELPISSLAQSTYILRLRAKAGEDEAEQHDAFRIVP